jgi:hypothetical protein
VAEETTGTHSKGGRKNENQESLDIHIRVAHREIVRAARENSKGVITNCPETINSL